ncbi:MAG: hypothetical protein KTR16_12695 [Acidiferrobacterales bacterium]|nr:hypothetical protein [Acidiferrobacterales bacterium]
MSKLQHVTEHDGSRWVDLEVAEEMYSVLEYLVENDIIVEHGIECEIKNLLTKARGELK